MTRETIQDLNTNTLIGYTDERGHAWHYRAGADNHFPGAIPMQVVRERLFNWSPLEADVQVIVPTESGVTTVTDPTRKAIVRSDTLAVMGIFGQAYQAHDYDEWLVKNVENIVDADLAIGSAGLLRGGALAWVQVEMKDTMVTPSGVEHRPFLLAATSLDGTLATTYKRCVQAVVCDNTLAVGLGEAGSVFRVKHTRHSALRLMDARQALSIVHETGAEFEAQVEALVAQTVTDAQWAKFLDAFTAPETPSPRSNTMASRKAGELNALWTADERVAPWAGTAYGVVAAVNTYVHHIGSVKNVTRAERNMERAMIGGVEAMDRKTLAVLASVR